MKTLVTLLLCIFSVSLSAQTGDEVRRAMDEYDYEKVISLTASGTPDSLAVALRAQAMKAMGRYPEAVAAFSSLLQEDSTSTRTLVDLAECYKAMGNSLGAVACYRKAVELRPENRFFRLQHIRLLLSAEDYEAAKTACHGWLERDTCSATGFKYLGQAYEGLEDMASAFMAYNAAYRRDSLDYQTVARIANLFNGNGQHQDAIQVTECYRLTDTISVDVNRQNAKAYCLKGDYPLAVERYEALKRLGDRSFTTYYYLGISHFGDNWFYGACDNLREAYRLRPTDINVLYYLGKSCSRTSWKKEGITYMEEALKLVQPTDSVMSRLYGGLVECYGRAGETYKKIETMQKLYKLNKNHHLFYSIARDYDWKEDYANAVYFYEKFMSLSPAESREPVCDEEGNPIEGAVTKYQLAQKRVKKIKEEDFFRNGAPKDKFWELKELGLKDGKEEKTGKKDTLPRRVFRIETEN